MKGQRSSPISEADRRQLDRAAVRLRGGHRRRPLAAPDRQASSTFKGSQYVRLTGATVDATYPKPIAGNWNGLPPDFQTGIDAAVFREANGKSYFFKGNRYVRLTETTVDDGYPPRSPATGTGSTRPSRRASTPR